ncbi:MAG: hypothetical protein HXS54_06350 [Theionarchaea archaeon]|nr:hypothetical protein [Theionarchaea archaeon]DBA34881.1 TPA_asm: hypothetical protein vir521_00087 [Caudoviricetes sp. vir521]
MDIQTYYGTMNKAGGYFRNDILLTFQVFEDEELTIKKDITGLDFTFTVRDRYDSAVALIQKTVGAGITLTNPTNGIGTIDLTRTDLTIDTGVYLCDLEMEEGGAFYTIFVKGFIVEWSVT